MTKLRTLNRNVLIALIVGLIVLEAGLIWAGAQALRREPASVAAPTPAAGLPRPTATLAPGKPTTAAVETPVVQPVERQPGPLVAGGDLLGVAKMFDAEEAMGFVEALCAPEFAGRQPGTEGSRLAGQYIADQFAAFGLQPAGTDGYFQPFTVPFAEITSVPTFVVTTTAGTVFDDFTYRKDFAFWWGGYAGAGEADGNVVWVNECRPQDFEGVDVAGQIAFCKFSPDDAVYRQALEHGAEGLILLADTVGRVDKIRTYRIVNYLPESLPSLIVLPQVAETLLTGSGYTVNDLSILYRSVPLNVSARFEIFLDEPGEAEARNVLGVLPGADPAQRDKVLIIGAHYDHLGTDANGDLYAGAHDDASGVAALLEIARSWQEAGFVPDMTVLFAAWDSEEQGLLGAFHYVRNPRYPIASTVGMIQLDMVALANAGVMTMDGYDNAVGRQLQASAALFDVRTAKVSFQGGSDHAAFQQANVAASVLIWDSGEVPYYHTPADTPSTLQPERLWQAGAMTSHAAMVLTTLEPRLRALLDAQAKAIAAGDSDAYVATLDPDDDALQQAGREWLATRPVESRQGYTITIGSLSIGGDTAQAAVTASAVDSDGKKTPLAAYPVQWVRRSAGWFASWPVAETLTTTHIAAGFVRADYDNADWLQTLDAAYASLAPVLGLAETPSFAATVYPDEKSLAWLAGAGTGAQTPLPGIHVVRTADVTPTVTSLILGGMGLPGGQGDWLRVGLSEWVKTAGDADARREQSRQMTPSLDSAATARSVFTQTASAFGVSGTAAAWSLADFFMRAYGPDGLRKACLAWGQAGTQEGAFAALGSTPEAFAQSWEAAVWQPLAEARAGIDIILDRREQAVSSGDKAAFLATVNPDDAVFLVEEGHWFDDLTKNPVAAYTLNAQVLSVDANGALAHLTMSARLQNASDSKAASYTARFIRLGDRWALAGPEWKMAEGGHFVVKYVGESEATARAALDAAEMAYAQVTADLNYTPASRTEIKLYDDLAVMHTSILLSLPEWANGWYEPGEAIKLGPRVDEAAFAAYIAHEFTHRALFDLGVSTAWIHEGVAVFESVRTQPERLASSQSRYVPVVREAQRTQNLFDWAAMPGWDGVSDERATLFYGQSWMLVDEFVKQFGMDALNRLIRGMGQGQAFDAAFAASSGVPFAEWKPQWEESVRLGGVPAELIRAAQGFSPDRALETVTLLSSTQFAGRLAGSPGARAAARSIADQMAALGFQPAAPDGTFFQTVPVPYAELTAIPTLRFGPTVTGAEVSLVYGETFREVVGGAAGGGDVQADIVWLPKDFRDDLNLGGRIALKYQTEDPLAEAENALAHGAGGLILVIKQSTFIDMTERSVPAGALQSQTIPVVQVREDTWRDIIKMAGLTAQEANNAPPALVASLQTRLAVQYATAASADALTVIGVLPGSNPDLRPLVVGAHYDGVGALPDGTLYPGANKNASGVAIMLEAARVLRDSGFQPSRSVYFIAWGAEEAGLASSRFYAGQPAVPLAQMMGLVELDKAGASRGYYLNLEGDKDGLESQLLFNLRLAADLLQRRESPAAYKGGDTHAIFRERGIPSALLFWPDADYIHTPQDTPDTLEPQKLATAGEVLTLAAMMLAR
jgi:Zn-dependent M28 family amino/carboxypeptidase